MIHLSTGAGARLARTHDMKSSAPRLWLAALAVSIGLAGCGTDQAGPPPDHGPVRPPSGSAPYIFPSIAYTGCDGVSSFKVPLATNLKGNVTWTVNDLNLAEVHTANAPQTYADFGENWALVETFKAGTVKVTATAGGQTAEATIVISKYEPAIVLAGRKRYYNPDNASGQRKACNDCHGNAQGADHSPLEMEFFMDDEILQAVVDGAYPDGYVLQQVDHKWALTDDERAGIVPFLRSLAPRGIY